MVPFIYDDVKIGIGSWRYPQHLIIIKDNKQGIYSIQERKVILEPAIDNKFHLHTDTIGENAIGFHTVDGTYGFINFEGNILFHIEKILY